MSETRKEQANTIPVWGKSQRNELTVGHKEAQKAPMAYSVVVLLSGFNHSCRAG